MSIYISNVKSQEYIEVWLEKYLSFLVIVVNNRYLPKCKFELESSAQLFFEKIQAFLDFRGFDFCNFWFTTFYNSILFSFPLEQ